MIVICGLNDLLNVEVGKMLSDSLDMFFLELEKFVEYDITNKQDAVKQISVDYLNKLEQKSVKYASSFQNTVMVASFDMLTFNKNYKHFKNNSLIIYLKQNKTTLSKVANANTLNLINFTSRNKQLTQIANQTLLLKNNLPTSAYEKIINYLKEVFLWI